VPVIGLASCLGLAFWVEPRIWLAGLAIILVGLGWQRLARRWWARPRG
jgi:APA family basic amino acid/polyamine antiporter